jgi:hypothetical protein
LVVVNSGKEILLIETDANTTVCGDHAAVKENWGGINSGNMVGGKGPTT